MRCGPWTFQIVGLYVWLVAAAVPCLLVLYYFGWRPLLAPSWGAYLLYHVSPLALTRAQLDASVPIPHSALLLRMATAAGAQMVRVLLVQRVAARVDGRAVRVELPDTRLAT